MKPETALKNPLNLTGDPLGVWPRNSKCPSYVLSRSPRCSAPDPITHFYFCCSGTPSAECRVHAGPETGLASAVPCYYAPRSNYNRLLSTDLTTWTGSFSPSSLLRPCLPFTWSVLCIFMLSIKLMHFVFVGLTFAFCTHMLMLRQNEIRELDLWGKLLLLSLCWFCVDLCLFTST